MRSRRVRRLAVLALCAAAAGVTAAVAQSAASHRAAMPAASATAETTAVQRWYVLQPGGFVSYDETSGLSELAAPETLDIAGEVQVNHEESTSNLPPLSNCLIKGQETISDPTEPSASGTAELTDLGISCEKGTGAVNAGQPYPCTQTGEPFELKAVGGPWTATLVPSTKKPGPYPRAIANEKFPKVELEVVCLHSRAHGIYTGAPNPEVTLGRLTFTQALAEFEEKSSGHHLFVKGNKVFISTPHYLNVRANRAGL
jgi:hypothetical protein